MTAPRRAAKEWRQALHVAAAEVLSAEIAYAYALEPARSDQCRQRCVEAHAAFTDLVAEVSDVAGRG